MPFLSFFLSLSLSLPYLLERLHFERAVAMVDDLPDDLWDVKVGGERGEREKENE